MNTDVSQAIMTPKPQRIQRKRTKGWRLPPNTVSVTRIGPFGNPFVVTDKVAPGKSVGGSYIAVPTAEDAVECFRIFLHEPEQTWRLEKIKALRGVSLACFCLLDQPCHADVLLEIANAE